MGRFSLTKKPQPFGYGYTVMPRPYRIAEDTGMLEYDDSTVYEGICPSCHSRHSGAWETCDYCLEREYEERMERHQQYLDANDIDEEE